VLALAGLNHATLFVQRTDPLEITYTLHRDFAAEQAICVVSLVVILFVFSVVMQRRQPHES
jgi:hypothetical protein